MARENGSVRTGVTGLYQGSQPRVCYYVSPLFHEEHEALFGRIKDETVRSTTELPSIPQTSIHRA